jgi:uncharacterized membrane protein YwzB
MPLISFVVTLLIIAILFWCVQRILMALHIAEPVATIVYVIFALIVVIWLASFLTGKPWLTLT